MHAISYQQNTGLTPVAMINRNQPGAADKHEQIRDAVRAWAASLDNQDVVAGIIVEEWERQGGAGLEFPEDLSRKRQKLFRWLDGDTEYARKNISQLAQFAFAEYSCSAATSVMCHSCCGTGRTTKEQVTRKVSYPWGKAPYWASRSRAVRPSDWELWTEVTEVVPAVCDVCEGKGTISARCRCGGIGEVVDRKATKERGVPVFKTCERCSGIGFSAISSATVYRVILKRLPDLHQSSWSRNWKPLFEMLVDTLRKWECQATVEFEKATT